MQADWYFDIISPFAYLQFERLGELQDEIDIDIEYRPVLLAGLLNHWGQLGPAEIEAKRIFTYRHVRWLADRRGLPLRLPEAHPFNPLKLLRLAILVGNDYAALQKLFRFVWRDGRIPEDAAAVTALAEELQVQDAEVRLSSPEVKQALRSNGERAIAAGVFGVPTFVVGQYLFWGEDATGMVADFSRDPQMFETGEMRRVETLPASARRQ